MKGLALLAKADTYLSSAQLLIDSGDTASAASRAYYAMFYAVEAALDARGIRTRTHAGAIAQFGQHFVKNGPLPPALLRELTEAHDLRLIGDYDAMKAIPTKEAQLLVDTARRFVAAIRPHVEGSA